MWAIQMTYSDDANLGILLNSVNYSGSGVEIISQARCNINPFYTNVSFLYLLKTPENL